jgi:hypothetical protein
MGRARVNLVDRYVICGYDRPMHSLFAQLYDSGDDSERDAPIKAVGYHPMERDPNERTEHWSWPAGVNELADALMDWGLSGEECEKVALAIRMDAAP